MNVLIAVGPQAPMMIQNLDDGPQAQGLIPKNEIFFIGEIVNKINKTKVIQRPGGMRADPGKPKREYNEKNQSKWINSNLS
jgi:hypothetical protein